jgi:hypothetical protein
MLIFKQLFTFLKCAVPSTEHFGTFCQSLTWIKAISVTLTEIFQSVLPIGQNFTIDNHHGQTLAYRTSLGPSFQL